MCNAWNHPSGCTCGWGGEGHVGRSYGNWGSGSTYNSSHGNSLGYKLGYKSDSVYPYVSYVNPNASCPVCGDAVFFYQSPHGGRVFFDSLGPPWPKHPCTDNSRLYDYEFIPLSSSEFESIASRTMEKKYEWYIDGWEPFECFKVETINKYLKIYKLSGRAAISNKIWIVYVKGRDFNFKNIPLLVKQSSRGSSRCSIATFELRGKGSKSKPVYIRATLLYVR